MAHEWVDDPRGVEELAAAVSAADVYALDTEFHRERTYFPRVGLVQVAWEGRVALVDAVAADVTPLAGVLTGPGLAVLHAADQDLDVLAHACGAVPARLFDTQLAAGFIGMSSPSLQLLVERTVGVRLRKGDRLADWTRRPLGQDQQAYAADDVRHLLEARDRLVERLAARGRLEWAEEECELLRCRPRVAPDPDTAWWRLRDARSLRGRSAGVAQEVAAWRERRAMALDVPPRFVVPDLALAAIAHRPPRSEAELAGVRGLDGRHLRGGTSEELMAAVDRGRALDDARLRRPPADDTDRSLRPAVALVAAWVAQLAADLDIDTSLLATRADVQAFLGGDPDAGLARGWRVGLVGDPVRRLVAGEAALAFQGSRLVLEARPGAAP